VRVLDSLDVDVDDIGLRRPTLDEVFLTLTGASIAEADPEADSGSGADGEPDATERPLASTAA